MDDSDSLKTESDLSEEEMDEESQEQKSTNFLLPPRETAILRLLSNIQEAEEDEDSDDMSVYKSQERSVSLPPSISEESKSQSLKPTANILIKNLDSSYAGSTSRKQDNSFEDSDLSSSESSESKPKGFVMGLSMVPEAVKAKFNIGNKVIHQMPNKIADILKDQQMTIAPINLNKLHRRHNSLNIDQLKFDALKSQNRAHIPLHSTGGMEADSFDQSGSDNTARTNQYAKPSVRGGKWKSFRL